MRFLNKIFGGSDSGGEAASQSSPTDIVCPGCGCKVVPRPDGTCGVCKHKFAPAEADALIEGRRRQEAGILEAKRRQEVKSEADFASWQTRPPTKPELMAKCLKMEWQKYLPTLQSSSGVLAGESSVLQTGNPIGPITMLDLRSNLEKRIQHDAQTGVRVGACFESVVHELIHCSENRMKRLGRVLDEAGGMKIMQAVCYAVGTRGGDAKRVERAWHGIGKWQA